jgi:hypothetical protein
MIDVDSAADYLLEKRLIDREAIIDGDLVVTSVARRNRNLRVEGPTGAGYLIKQPDDPSQGDDESLRREAAFYAFCHQEPAAAAVARVLPRLQYYDPAQPLLAVELLGGATPLWHQLSAPEARQAFAPLARSVGGALGSLHDTFRPADPAADPRLGWLPRHLPWVMLAHKPGPQLLASISPANYQALRILQTQDRLGERLDQLRKLWQPETVIHNDVRSDNILVLPAGAPDAGAVRLVDWEMVQVGDPAWDVAGLFQDLVLFWIDSMPLANAGGVERLAAEAHCPWPAVQGALRAFWQEYARAAGLAPAEANRLLLRAVSFSAARLIQTAYEFSQSLSSMPAQSVLLLQVSANLLEDPETAQVGFYGIPQTFAG